ncbi:GNAT family N-acetyltransferase [Halomonas sp. PAMB 3264]|uniref:GNAT family N-acetyltransferase n=1 Tax=Halomonas sp. PAMB 3264 TaxID=3075222 RepID=UPI002898D289|nr:GNAT family N-acetyltransferase [Halomonas sp. PAMB 3264]WNL43440.1 GNAT family N-acetyltransferase [Halomonas sp. PAMB 3264]
MWQTRWATPADEPALLALFERAFGHSMDAATWRWKYRLAESPGVVCLDDDAIIAFNGGMPRRGVVKGEPCSLVQMGDVMVDPAYRGILTRKGPFYQVVHDFFKEQVGQDLAHRFAFGFPHARHARLGQALKLYCSTDRILEAEWAALPTRHWRATACEVSAEHAATVDALWARMAQGLGDKAVGVRDWAWLSHRYIEAPARGYQVWLVRERLTGRALGVCVLRAHDSDTVELLDVVAGQAQLTETVRCAQHLTARMGAKRLIGWLTPAVAERLNKTRPALQETDVVVPGSQVNGLALGMDVEKRWWLTGGDTDFR